MTVQTENKVLELKMYINGEWKTSSNDDINEVRNPATGELIARAREQQKQKQRKRSK